MRARHLCIFIVLALFAVAAPSASAAGLVVHLKAPNHHPKAGKLWYITVSARTTTGRAVKAVAWYEFYYNGQKVAQRNPSPNNPRDENGGPRPWAFKGSYRDGILWPKRSVGIPLTFRVVVKAKGYGVKSANWKVVVRR